MKRNPTSLDVARAAGVSQATVSRVFNNPGHVTVLSSTRERVLKAAAALGYRPNAAARSLVSGRTGMVGLCFANLHTAFYGRVFYEAQRVGRSYNYGVIISDQTDKVLEGVDVAELVHWRVDGIIAFGVRTFSTRPPEETVPLVVVGTHIWQEGDFVDCDHYDGTRQAVHHLFERGCRRIGYMAPVAPGWEKTVRYVAYTETMRQLGLEPVYLPLEKHSRDQAYDVTLRTARESRLPDGIFCYNDEIALGVHSACYDLGINMPRDLKLVGFDGIEETTYVRPRLTTVVQPVRKMAELAWEFLDRRIKHRSVPPQQMTLSTKLEIRETT